VVTADIITIGDEILIGQIIDTNSAYIAARLNALGIRVGTILSVGDTRQAIWTALEQSSQQADVLVLTGGLGPTNDDITKKLLAEYTGSQQWVVHEETLKNIQQITTQRGLPMNRQNCDQALVPDTCEVLLNTLGTAPGMWFNYRGKIIISLPGVPFEMHHLLDKVVQGLQTNFTIPPVYHRIITTFGLPESVLAERIADWEQALPPHIRLAYLPNPLTGVRLRLSVYEPDNATEAEVAQAVVALRAVLGDVIYGEGADTLETVTGQLLRAHKATVSTAESCTGGKIASLITAIPGSSAYFKGSVVAYDNAVKINVLGVDPKTIAQYGAVSLPVVEQMAAGARRLLQTDYAVATSGVAGPDGGTPEKPTGTVCIAVATPQGVLSETHHFTNDRQRNIERSSANALNMLRLALLKRS
jgi:nicotinamide-nucleotide amidase